MGAPAHSPVWVHLREPLAHAYALRSILVLGMLKGLLLFLPLPLPVLGVPIVGSLAAVLVGVVVANAQKRL